MVLFTGTAEPEMQERPYLFRVQLAHGAASSAQLVATSQDESPALSIEEIRPAPIDAGTEAFLEQIVSSTTADATRYPTNARLAIARGVALRNAGREAEAIAALRQGVEISPTSAYAHFELGRALLTGGEHMAAVREFEIAAKAGGRLRQRSMLATAQALFQAGSLDEAINTVRSTIEGSDMPAAHFLFGLMLLAKPDPKTAIHHLRLATQAVPRRAEFHQGLGVAYAMQGQRGKAVRSFKESLYLRPGMSESLEALTRVLIEAGEAPQAAEYLERFVETHPANAMARELLAIALMEAQRPGPARSMLFSALRLTTDQSEADVWAIARIANNLGVIYWRTGSLGEAERLVRRAMSEPEASSTVAARNLATLLAERQRVPEATELLLSVLERDATDAEARKILVSCHAIEGDYESAVEQARLVIQSRPAADGYAVLGALLTDGLTDTKAAIRTLGEGLALFPQDPMLLNNLAYSLLMSHKVQDAKKTLEEIGNVTDEAAPFVIATRGLLRLQEGALDEGETLYLEAAQFARRSDRASLADQIDQKRHLELARASLAIGDLAKARKEVGLGLATVGRPSFMRDLQDLGQSIPGD